jgi:hypothetical protein
MRTTVPITGASHGLLDVTLGMERRDSSLDGLSVEPSHDHRIVSGCWTTEG